MIHPLWAIFCATSFACVALSISVLNTNPDLIKYNGPNIKKSFFFEEEQDGATQPLIATPCPNNIEFKQDEDNPIINIVDKASLYFRLINEGIPVNLARVLTSEPDPAYVYSQLNTSQSGVDDLEISPCVFVKHNFSAIRSDRTIVEHNKNITILTFDSGFMKEHFLILPPFLWDIPRGLTPEQMELYWLQPENKCFPHKCHLGDRKRNCVVPKQFRLQRKSHTSH